MKEDTDELKPQKPGRAGAIAGLVMLGVLTAAAIWIAATQQNSKGLLERRQEEYRIAGATQAPIPAPAVPPPVEAPRAAPSDQDDARNRELAERLLLMQQQAEIARLAKLQEEQMKRDADERAKRAKRLAADLLVYSSGGRVGTAPAAGDTVDPFARTAGQGGDEERKDWLPEPAQTVRGGAVAVMAQAQASTLYQGRMISAVLETAIESEKPGMIRAMVDEDVYAEDGSSVLVPSGSRLIGEYRSQVVRGDRRVLVIWNRLITPDAVSVQLASPGTDELGVAGLTGDVDSRFFERFGAAVLLSFVEGVAQRADDSTAVYLSDAERASSVALRDSINIPPRIRVHQGSRISVLIARDLDFAQVRRG